MTKQKEKNPKKLIIGIILIIIGVGIIFLG
jgi:hypothetical protein